VVRLVTADRARLAVLALVASAAWTVPNALTMFGELADVSRLDLLNQ
jgi:hypothetical protein